MEEGKTLEEGTALEAWKVLNEEKNFKEMGEASAVRFSAGGKTVTVYPCAAADRPVVYLNTFSGEGEQVCRELRRNACPDFTLVTINGLAWEHDMTPWGIPPVSAEAAPCTGGAEEYLRLLTGEILPRAEREISGGVRWRGLAGYSLGGLFAVFALYRTELFARAASVSGSLWFPQFREYVLSHEMKGCPECLFFSLGDREARTGNPYLRLVQQRTEEIEAFCRKKGLDTTLQMYPGGHGKNVVQRTGQGILWILNRKESQERH